MTEWSTFDPFELRLAAELERYVVSATDPKPAADVARVAMQPRGLGVRVRNTSGRRRTLLLAFAAALLVPAVYLGTGGMRQPAPDQGLVVQPDPNDVALTTAVPILIRRIEGNDPGLSIVAVRPDGTEVLIRSLSDSIVGGPGALTGYGRVSSSGWLEVSATRGNQSWPMVLVNLREPGSVPWVVDESSDGGISPAWGPDGTIAALQHEGNGNLVIVDPEAHSVKTLVMGESLVGGGPSIVWTRDGSGIFGADDAGHQDIVPIEGFGHRPATDAVFDPRGAYGTGLATVRLCATGSGECGADDDGRVQRIEGGGSAITTLWEQPGGERALAAGFGDTSEDYWLAADQDQGRKVALIHLHDGNEDRVAVLDRGIGWTDVGAPVAAPDQSVVVEWVYQDPTEAAVVVPLDGGAPSFHLGHLAGFVDRAAAAAIGHGSAATTPGPMPLAGNLYELPSVDELVAAELAFNPGHRVLFSASRDAIDGDTGIRTIPLTPNQPGPGDAHLVCFGPASATVSSGDYQVSNPCLRSGGVQFQLIPDSPLSIETTGDTTWRLVVYNN